MNPSRLSALFAAALLPFGNGQAQVLDPVEDGLPCRDEIGCQLVIDLARTRIPADVCVGEAPLSLNAGGERLWLSMRSSRRPDSVTGSLFTRHFDQIGDGCWTAVWHLPHLSQSSLQFYAFQEDGRRLGQASFRGADLASGVEYAELRTEIESISIHDSLSGMERAVHVYAPPQLDGEPAPVLILPDGQVITRYARILQELIDRGMVAPMRVVAIEARMDTPFARNHEYIASPDNDLHTAYLTFFEEEFIPWIAERYRGQVTRDGWIIFGASASATFALSASRTATPITRVIATSPTRSELDFLQAPPRVDVEFHISSGWYEMEFRRAAEDYSARLRDHPNTVHTYCYFSGHDLFTWEAAFRDALVNMSGGHVSPRCPVPER